MTRTADRTKARKSLPEEPSRLGLNERLALIGLIDEGMRQGAAHCPMVADLFTELGDLVNGTVSGAKIDRLRSDSAGNGFKVIEINAETGENLGRLTMLYLKKPIPCYYLVYVEVAPPFRNKGLGNRILRAFRDFLVEKSAVGILDNIIPEDDPTYDIYVKLEWQSMEAVVGPERAGAGESVYMIFVPPALAGRDLKEPIRRLLHHLKRKRASIDMRDNELMVKRTIEEFKDLLSALMTYFAHDLKGEGDPGSLVRFMFTRYVTKLLGFRRRIGRLLGYTGGESLDQIALPPEVCGLQVQSYAPKELQQKPYFVSGDKELWLLLPEELKQNPARFIEALPNYRRPSLVSWLEARGRTASDQFTIGDIMDLGFDPTRLKEISYGGREYIFERVQPRLLPSLDQRKDVFERIAGEIEAVRIKNARIRTNAPLLVVGDRGNLYVLRHKVDGIHWEEAVDRLQADPSLKAFNAATSADRIILATVRQASDWLRPRLSEDEAGLPDQVSFFVSWNLGSNQPRLIVDFAGTFLETIWIA